MRDKMISETLTTDYYKNLLFLRGPNLAQKPLYLVGTARKELETDLGIPLVLLDP